MTASGPMRETASCCFPAVGGDAAELKGAADCVGALADDAWQRVYQTAAGAGCQRCGPNGQDVRPRLVASAHGPPFGDPRGGGVERPPWRAQPARLCHLGG